MGSFLDLEAKFPFYYAFHRNRVNQAIHVVCVWPILWTAMAGMQLAAPLYGPLAVASFYGTIFLAFDRPTGIICNALLAAGVAGCHVLSKAIDTRTFALTAAGVHVGCWIAQFYGHAVFEKRRPALFDNLFQALLMAPFFVTIEVMNWTFKYEPSEGFFKRASNKAAKILKASQQQ
jgi:uncharacterized membrane protein YGL010W